MDRYSDVVHVLNVAPSPLEVIVSLSDAVELAKIASDEMADLVQKYPDKFIAAVASLPLNDNDIDVALKEADRAITQLRFRGVSIFSVIDGEALDTPKFRPLYERMLSMTYPYGSIPGIYQEQQGQPVKAHLN